MLFWLACFSYSVGPGLYSLPRLWDYAPISTFYCACLAIQSLKPGMCTLILFPSTTENCCPVRRLQPKSIYARQLWVSSSRRKLWLKLSNSRHKVQDALFPLPWTLHESSLNTLPCLYASLACLLSSLWLTPFSADVFFIVEESSAQIMDVPINTISCTKHSLTNPLTCRNGSVFN